MPEERGLHNADVFSAILYEKLQRINIGVAAVEPYEFRYALDNLYPEEGGWSSVETDRADVIEAMINRSGFYKGIQVKPQIGGRIVLDKNIVRLARMLFVGLVTGKYAESWVGEHFYFDIRGFFFLHRTTYFTDRILAHLGSEPFRRFERRQKRFDSYQDIGYKDFKDANAEVDHLFIESIEKLIAVKGTPILLALAGPTAAGKTEIVARLRASLEQGGMRVSSIEMDNFLTDRDYREAKGIHSLGKEAIHFALFKESLERISRGQRISIPRYDFVFATSSHDLNGRLKPGGRPINIEPADIIFIEGNFPFLLGDVVDLIGVKIVYLTDDAVRLKRKWKRDIDYRKKYEPTYFRNRFFKEQFLMAETCYRPQMEVCDMVVDTSGSALWTTAEIAGILQTARD